MPPIRLEDPPLLSGEVHFWRIDPADWEPVLRAVAEERIPIVATYLSWRRHMPDPDAPPVFEQDERLDVKRFLRLCAAHGLLVHLKPGPWICAEEPGGGYPEWLLADRELLALDASGAPISGYNPPFKHPVPSYLHPRYLAHARRWITLVDRYLADLVHPRGPIALVQLDNEPSYCFQDSMYGADYHPVVLAAFARWLRRDAEPPRRPLADDDPESRRREHEWIRFREWLLAEHLRRIRGWHERAGLRDVVFTVNYNTHPIHTVPQAPKAIRRAVGAVGGHDFYYEPPLNMTDVLALARVAASLRASEEPLPWAPEIQAGIWRSSGERVDNPDPTAAEQIVYYTAALAFGLRGLNFYMLVDRENWELAPLGPNGSPGPMITSVRHGAALLEALRALGPLEPVSPIALMWHRPYARDAYAGRPVAYEAWGAAFDVLAAAGYLPRIWDTEVPPPSDVAAIVAPVGSYLPRSVEDRLLGLARQGVATVLLGDPLRLERLESLVRVGRTEELPATLVAQKVEPPVAWDDDCALAILQEGAGRQVLFLLYLGGRRATVALRLRERLNGRLRPLLGAGDAVPLAGGTARVTVEPCSAAVFELGQ